MTNITELAQSLKRRAASANEFGESLYVKADDVIALVEALEKAQRYIEELREWNAGLAQESFERQQRILELLEGKVGNALLERENHHVEVVGKLAERIAELEESHAQVIQSRDHYKRITEEGLRRLAESRTVKLPALPRLGANTEWYQGFAAGAESMRSDCAHAINAAGIKVEAE